MGIGDISSPKLGVSSGIGGFSKPRSELGLFTLHKQRVTVSDSMQKVSLCRVVNVKPKLQCGRWRC